MYSNFKICSNFVQRVQEKMDSGEFGQALYMTEMMVTSIKEEGNDWAKFRIPVCGLLFGTFQLRADEYDTTVVKADAEEEIKTLQQSPCV